MSLADKAVLVQVTVNCWSAQKLDRDATDELTKEKGAEKDAAKVQKRLVQSEHYDAFRSITNEARVRSYAKTLPWLDGGLRICPNAIYQEWRDMMSDYNHRATVEAEAFLAEYEARIEAAKTELGGMFDADDYPTVNQLRKRFGIKLTVMPIAPAKLAKDFRVEGEPDHLTAIEKAVDIGVWSRLRDTLQRVATTLGNPDSAVTKSLVNHIAEIVENVPKLNITENPEVAKIVAEMKKTMAGVDRETLKAADVRKRVAEQAVTLEKKARGFLADLGVNGQDEAEEKPKSKKTEQAEPVAAEAPAPEPEPIEKSKAEKPKAEKSKAEKPKAEKPKAEKPKAKKAAPKKIRRGVRAR